MSSIWVTENSTCRIETAWPGVQHAWRLCDDGRGWLADVEFTALHDWGRGKYVPVVAPGRVRIAD